MIARLACAGALFLVLTGLGSAPSGAQGSAASPRPVITQPIDDSNLAALPGQVRPEVDTRNDRGALPDDTPLPHLLLQLKRPPGQEQALQQFIDQLHNPNSPDFHHWLNAPAFGARFGLATQDIEATTNWLEQQGFQINAVYPNGTLIDFSATAGQIRAAFHTELHRLRVGSETHFANLSAPQIPAALSGVVAGIVGLHDFKPHRQDHARTSYTLSVGDHLLVPADLATIYNLNPLFNEGNTGQGQTIAVIEDTNVFSTSDWSTFRSVFGLSIYSGGSFSQTHPAPPAGANNCSNPGTNGDEGEAILDAEWASAAAPSAAIVLASCSNTPDGLLIAIQNLVNGASPPPIISVSYGECEAQNTDTAAYNAAYQQAVAEGISVFVASGDWGAAVCDGSDSPPPAATQGIGVNALASSPYAVAVGGTDFEDVVNGTSNNYWNTSNGATFGSARSYVPEIPWNDSCASTLIARFVTGNSLTYGSSGFCNSATARNDGLLNIIGGSGGPSKVFGKPSWQAGFAGVQADGARDLPDVSLFAGNGIWGHYYVFCWSDPGQTRNGAAACTGAPSTWSGAGGTSFAAPILAGMQALVNQQTAQRQGNPNPVYYALAQSEYGTGGNASCNSSAGNGPASSCIFFDVTQGDDDVPCTGSNNCYRPSGIDGVLSTSNGAYAPAFAASTGWDFASGIGTINAYNLVHAWNQQLTVTLSGSGAVTSTPSGINCGATCSTTFVAGQQVTLTATPSVGWLFTGWSGACSGTGSCVLTMNAAQSVVATFVQQSFTLSVSVSGSGSVTSTPGGINCGATCSSAFNNGELVVLSATPAAGWALSGWGGACSGNTGCSVTMNGPNSVSATFIRVFTLNVSETGAGTVTSSPSGVSCGATCSARYASGQGVTLTATPSAHWAFLGWGGACSGSAACGVTMSADQSVTATFAATSSGGGGAAVNTWAYFCNGNSFDDLNGALAGTAAWSFSTAASALANGNRGQPAAGDIIEIVNTCLGDVTIGVSNVIITNHNDSAPAGADGIIGQLELPGVNGEMIRNLTMTAPSSGGFAPGTSNFTGAEVAMVYVRDGASATLQASVIHPGPIDGVAITRTSSAVLLGNSIAPNNTAYAASVANGITVSDGSSAVLGNPDGTGGDDLANNYNGYGIAVYRGAVAEIFGSLFSDNQNGQLLGSDGAAIRLVGSQVNQVSATQPAIQVAANSSLVLEPLDDGTFDRVNGNFGGGLYAANHSSVLARGAAITSNAAVPAVQISGTSTLILAGGNSFASNSNMGLVAQIDHTSSLLQTSGPQLGYTTSLADVFVGSGFVAAQSSLDLGLGFLPGTSNPTFTWTLPSTTCLVVQENSALRLSGGVAFSGAAPAACPANGNAVSSTIVVAASSNIFINTGQGGTNTISGGGFITCPFTGMPSAHVTGAKNVTPTMAVTGGWSAGATASSPSCLGP